ncbi:MAG: MFS transporter [Candidatus Bathyarchaeia archaeon]
MRIKLDANLSLSIKRVFQRESVEVFVVVANTFAWYTLVYIFYRSIVENLPLTASESLSTFVFFYLGIAFSAVLNSVIIRKVARDFLLLIWFFLGVCASLLLFVIDISLPTSAYAVSIFLGVSIGIGLPSCLAYFADAVKLENRGKAGGIIWASAGVGTLVFAAPAYILNNIATAILLLTVLRLSGLLFFLFKREQKTAVGLKRDYPFHAILRDSHVLLYLLPWVMFCLINWIESPIVENLFGSEFFNFVTFTEFAISGVFALVGGIFSDWVGRKRIIIIGFIMLGIEYAVLSFLQNSIISRYIYIAFDGITWGMFAVVFFIVLWGDLAKDSLKEKYYIIGGLPYLLASFLQVFIKQYIASIPENMRLGLVNTAFSLASFFLFLAILPLIYAPETLPEKKIADRQLRKYAEEAKKIVEKEVEKKKV